MPYANGDPTLSEQIEQHMENIAIGKDLKACWNEGFAKGQAERDRLKSINLDLLAALLALSNAVDVAEDYLTQESVSIPSRITSQADAAIARATEKDEESP